MKIKIPKCDITVKQIQYKGNPQDITVFSAYGEDGTLYAVCEAWGNKKKALEELAGTDKLTEAEKIEHNSQYNKYNVFFPRGFGSEGNFRDKNRGGWVPGGYQGKPVSEDRFWALTESLMPKAVKAIRHGMTAERFDKLTPAEVAAIIMPIAQDLVSQFWIEVEKNVTFPDGCEPAAKAAASTESTATATTSNGSAASASADEQAIMDEVAAWTVYDEAAKDKITARINTLNVPIDRRVEMHGVVFSRKKELQAKAAN